MLASDALKCIQVKHDIILIGRSDPAKKPCATASWQQSRRQELSPDLSSSATCRAGKTAPDSAAAVKWRGRLRGKLPATVAKVKNGLF
jgi:hypothetical protein